MPQEVVLQRAQKKVKKLKSNNDCSWRRSGADRDTTQRSQPGRPQSGVWGRLWKTTQDLGNLGWYSDSSLSAVCSDYFLKESEDNTI